MIHLSQINKDAQEFNDEYKYLVKTAKPLIYYNNEGTILYLLNTWKLEDYIVKDLQYKNKDCIIEHVDKYWDYYYPEVNSIDNGPDIKMGNFYIEVKSFYDVNKFNRTKNFYSHAYKYGLQSAKNKYGQNMYVKDYRDKGYDTKLMCFILISKDHTVLTIDYMNTADGNIIASNKINSNLELWVIDEKYKK